MSATAEQLSAVDLEYVKLLELARSAHVATKEIIQKKQSSNPPRIVLLHKIRELIDAELMPATIAPPPPPSYADATAPVAVKESKRLTPADKVCNTSQWVLLSERPPQLAKRAWEAIPASTHTIHRQWLQRLKDMPTTLQQLPLSQACVEVLKWKCIEERWTWSTLQRCASEMEEALSHLCFYTREKSYVDLSRSIVWKQGLVEVHRLHTTPSPESPMEVIVPLSVDDFERVREMLYNRKLSEAGLYLVLMWVLCASPEEVDSLVVEDLHLFNDTSMWDSAMWCPDMVDLMATVRLPRGTRRGPFQVPTSLLMKDMQKLELLLMKRHKTERLFKHPEVLRGQVQALLEQQCQLSKPSLLSVRMGAAARLVEAGHGKASLWLDVSEQRSEAATQSAVAAARRMSMCLHFNSDDGREKCCWRIGEEMHDPTTRMGFYIAHAKLDDADALVKHITTTMTEPTVLSADRQHDASKWFVLCERPPHITEAEWAAAPRKARASHRCWLRQLQKLPPRTLKFSLAKACLKMFGELLAWRLSRDRVKHAAEELEAALMLLPMYTMQTLSIDLHASAVWRSGIEAMERVDHDCDSDNPWRFNSDTFEHVKRQLHLRGFREASVYLTLMWLMAARPEDVESLVVKDIHVGPLPGTPEGSLKNDLWLDLVVTVRVAHDNRRGPFVVPTIISYMDAYRLVDLMSRRGKNERLFQEPPRVLREQLRMIISRSYGLEDTSLEKVREGAIYYVGSNEGILGPQWIEGNKLSEEGLRAGVKHARRTNIFLYLAPDDDDDDDDLDVGFDLGDDDDDDDWDEFSSEETVYDMSWELVKRVHPAVNHNTNIARLMMGLSTCNGTNPPPVAKRMRSADLRYNVSKWVVLSERPSHVSDDSWNAVPKASRTVHRRWLRRLTGMPREPKELLSETCLRAVMEARDEKFWTSSGINHAINGLELALMYLPNYTDQTEGIDLTLSSVWNDGVKEMLHECCVAKQPPKSELLRTLGTTELQRIKELLLDRGQRAAFVYLVLMWVMAARPSEVDSLTAEDIALSPRNVEGIVSATSLHPQLEVMNLSATARRPCGATSKRFIIPTTIMVEDGQRLEFLRRLPPKRKIFPNPTEVQKQIQDAIAHITSIHNLSLLIVREKSLQLVKDSVAIPRWIDLTVQRSAVHLNSLMDKVRLETIFLHEHYYYGMDEVEYDDYDNYGDDLMGFPDPGADPVGFYLNHLELTSR